MSDEPSEQQHPCPHPEAVGTRYGDPIPPERQAELQGYLDRWKAETDRGERKGPFDRGPFESGMPLSAADVFWLAEQSGRGEYGVVPNLHLEGANLGAAHLEGARLSAAHLERTNLYAARLERTNLYAARLEQAILIEAHLEMAYLSAARLERTNLYAARLDQADLRNAWMDKATLLNEATLDRASLDQLSFDGANLAVVKWESVEMLGDEVRARAVKDDDGKRKDRATRVGEYEAAIRAQIQLAAVLRSQGMSEQADRFTYRSQRLRRTRYRMQRRVGQWLFSWLLAATAGYGYRLERILITYGLAVTAFAALYLSVGIPGGFPPGTAPIVDAFQVSITAIHGRVFFEQLKLGSMTAWVAAAESIVGIIIESIFSAMLIQRFFGK